VSRPQRILVVDDERTIVFALKAYFTRDGCLVDCANGSEGALALLATHLYDVAIVDVQLQGTASHDGLDLAAHIRTHYPTTVVIVLTGLETAETDRRAAEAGVHSLLRKPMRLAHVADLAFELVRHQAAAAL
jgi:DNA-binding response OmpR family regulator